MCTPPLWPKRILPTNRPRHLPAMRSTTCRSAQSGCRRNISMTRPVRNCSKQITRLPEYYPTRTELSILRDRGSEIAAIIPKGAALVEFGAGATTKVRLLLKKCAFGAYVPVDISGDFLKAQADALAQGFPGACRLSGGGGFHRAVRVARRDRRDAEGRILSRARRSAISSRTRPAPSCAAPARFSAKARRWSSASTSKRTSACCTTPITMPPASPRASISTCWSASTANSAAISTSPPSPIARSTTASGTASRCT